MPVLHRRSVCSRKNITNATCRINPIGKFEPRHEKIKKIRTYLLINPVKANLIRRPWHVSHNAFQNQEYPFLPQNLNICHIVTYTKNNDIVSPFYNKRSLFWHQTAMLIYLLLDQWMNVSTQQYQKQKLILFVGRTESGWAILHIVRFRQKKLRCRYYTF